VLPGLRGEHELRERPVQPREAALHHREARARELGARVEIEPDAGAHVDVVLRREVELAGRAPAAHLDVVVARRALGHLGTRNVRDHAQEGVELLLRHGERRLVGFQAVAQARDLGHHGGRVLALALQHANLLVERVALRLQLLGA